MKIMQLYVNSGVTTNGMWTASMGRMSFNQKWGGSFLSNQASHFLKKKMRTSHLPGGANMIQKYDGKGSYT